MAKPPQRVHSEPAAHDRELARAVLAAAPDRKAAAATRDRAVERLRAARDDLARQTADLAPLAAARDDEWSVMHVLAHVGKDNGGHFTHVYDVIERGIAELEPFETREERLRTAAAAALASVDEAIAFAERLAPADLVRHAARGGREHYVVGFLEAAADHLEAHVAQLRATASASPGTPA